jgi:Zn-dependent protease with chaperone function
MSTTSLKHQLTLPFRFVNVTADLVLDREPWACIAGLVCGWTALFAAIWFAVLFAIVGAIGGFFIAGFVTLGIGQASQGTALLGGITGMLYGFLAGFGLVFGSALSQAPLHILLSLFAGVVLAVLVSFAVMALEPTLLDLRGYRRLSRRADEAKLLDMRDVVAAGMGLQRVVPLLIADDPVPGAWAHTRHIVLSKGLLEQLTDAELQGILAHELQHWVRQDALVSRFVWACSLPLVLFVNLFYVVEYAAKNAKLPELVSLGVGILVWPALVLLRLVVEPTMAAHSRRTEYQADAAAIAAGYGPALADALTKLKDFEIARSGWEQAQLRTHPPIEFRLEAIEEAGQPPRSSSRARRATGAREVAPAS